MKSRNAGELCAGKDTSLSHGSGTQHRAESGAEGVSWGEEAGCTESGQREPRSSDGLAGVQLAKDLRCLQTPDLGVHTRDRGLP